MTDQRIHRHSWENGRCKFCGVEQRIAESELDASSGSKPKPVTYDQAKKLIELASCILWELVLVIGLVFGIWVAQMLK